MRGYKLRNKYIPMSETAYYILLSLIKPRHGYGIKQHVQELTAGRLDIGAGTMYSTLSRMEKDRLIIPVKEENRRKIYQISDTGKELLEAEVARLKNLYEHSIDQFEGGIHNG